MVVLLAGAAGHRAVFALILLSPLMWDVLHPLVDDYLARRVSDRERATVLSLNSMASQLGTAISTSIVGVVADGSSPVAERRA
jgi:predicted MFS family arabinose efflux permease